MGIHGSYRKKGLVREGIGARASWENVWGGVGKLLGRVGGNIIRDNILYRGKGIGIILLIIILII